MMLEKVFTWKMNKIFNLEKHNQLFFYGLRTITLL